MTTALEFVRANYSFTDDVLEANVRRLGADDDDVMALLDEAANLRRNGTEPEPAPEPRVFPGLSYEEMLAAEVDPARELVADLVEAGTVGTIASIPELGKSYLAVEIAHKVAAGGTVLGRFDVRNRGPVAYWWQDDSRANELARLKSYAAAHDYTTAPAAIRWHLNEGARLPDDLAAIRAEVEREQQVLVVLDSFYNFAPGLDLKDEDVALVYAALKNDLCDPTGATVLVVDHAPWPTEATRSQRARAYGSVFKGAAIRWGIYLEPDGKTKSYIAARGNNIRGLKRTPYTFNEDRLELHLVETDHVEADEYEERVLAYLAANPWATTEEVDRKSGGREVDVRRARQRLADPSGASRIVGRPSRELGRPGKGMRWNLASEAAPSPVPLFPDGEGRGTREPGDLSSPEPSSPVGGGAAAGRGTDPEDTELARLEALALEALQAETDDAP